MPRKAVLVITLHRRYHELSRNLPRVRDFFKEISSPPSVILVVAQPEMAAIPLYRGMLSAGQVDHVVYRPSTGKEKDFSTTHPESHNLDVGIRLARDLYGKDAYVICQSVDILPRAGTYQLIDRHMQKGGRGVCFHWENSVSRANVWHTNLFAISLDDPSYWPPVIAADHPDVLERIWGEKISPYRHIIHPLGNGGLLLTHNSNSKRFLHEHISEILPAYQLPVEPTPLPPPLTWWQRMWHGVFNLKWKKENSRGENRC